MEEKPLFGWTWEIRPATDEEYERMMISLDRYLASEGLGPGQRPLNAMLAVSSALELSGTPVLWGLGDRGEPFSPRDLLARVHDWYGETYGEKAKFDFSPGSIVVSLHGNLWEMKMPKVWGSARMFISTDIRTEGNRFATNGSPPIQHNILCLVQGMTQAYANRLTNEELHLLFDKFLVGAEAVAWLDDLRGHDLFDEARGDYRHSVDALLTGHELSKARWDTAQCAEKVMKGLLARDGHEYPTFGTRGHDIRHLGSLIKEKLGIELPGSELTVVHCSPAVRYGEEKSTVEWAIEAHNALIHLLRRLAHNCELSPH
ncbi:hypothetical protein [Achromobacter animicus]|uniref:hypothetical protein n=1 Tax=Achromobacter animicus TaxID=1389935 RepID=UPI0028A7106F|nr:hypothetical protein [Achromobacter animicus]